MCVYICLNTSNTNDHLCLRSFTFKDVGCRVWDFGFRVLVSDGFGKFRGVFAWCYILFGV